MGKHKIYVVKKGDIVNTDWMKKHSTVAIIRGNIWDPAIEKEVYSDMINPFGPLGYRRT